MRVLVVTPWFPTRRLPAMTPFMLRDVELLKKDHEVLVVHLNQEADRPLRNLVSGVRVVQVPYHHTKPKTWLAAARIIKRYSGQADAVHSMAFPALLPAWLARLQLPWVHTEHFSELVAEDLSPSQELLLAVGRLLLRFPDQVVAVGQALGTALGRHRSKPVPVIPNAVVTSAVRRTSREELQAGVPVRMVGVGSLIPGKGPKEAVQTLAVLRGQGIDATLDWVGPGPLEEEVLLLAQQLEVDRYLKLHGAVAPADVPALLASGNVFVLPTAHETFGVAFAEALGHGLPVVATGFGGHLEFLPPEGSRIVSARTGDALAEAVIALMRDPGRWDTEQLIQYARKTFAEADRVEAYRGVYAVATAHHPTSQQKAKRNPTVRGRCRLWAPSTDKRGSMNESPASLGAHLAAKGRIE